MDHDPLALHFVHQAVRGENQLSKARVGWIWIGASTLAQLR